MHPFASNGEVWRVLRVEPGDPRLTDRTGRERLGVTDPTTRTVYLSSALEPPLLDRVMLHEAAHAVSMSHGLLETLHEIVPMSRWVDAEEWSAQLVEGYGIEAAEAASAALGRPVCVRGFCHEKGG